MAVYGFILIYMAVYGGIWLEIAGNTRKQQEIGFAAICS